jgi:Lrp/AsnC family transcriptional regulator for asnA, asnC and gidA
MARPMKSTESVNRRKIVALDGIDDAIIALMRREPDIASRDIARRLELTEKTVRLHLRRLHALNVLRVVTMVSLPAVGLPFLAAAGVRVRGRAPLEVAAEVARIPQVITVNVVLGNQDLEIQIVTATLRELADLLTERIAKIKGVGSVAVGLALRVLKHEVLWVPFPRTSAGRRAGDLPAPVGDELDTKIIGCLANDSRISNRAVARLLRVNEGTVRTRRRRMLAKRLVRTATVLNVQQLRNPVVAYFWITVDSASNLRTVAEALAKLPQITFVALMSGRCDVLGITLVESSEELLTLLHQTLDKIPGIYRTQHTLSQSTLKHDSRWCVVPERD